MKPIRVLIADDHTLFREALHKLLELENDIVVVAEAKNGLEAEQLFYQLAPDVVVMDLVMPHLDGVEASRAILNHNPRARILALTMVADDKKILEAIRVGVRGYLLKDCSGAELAEAVRIVYQGQGFFPPVVAKVIGNELRQPAEKVKGRTPFTITEIKILSLLVEGMSNEEIAQQLSLSTKTVRNRISSILTRLNLKNRTQAVLFAIKEGYVPFNFN